MFLELGYYMILAIRCYKELLDQTERQNRGFKVV